MTFDAPGVSGFMWAAFFFTGKFPAFRVLLRSTIRALEKLPDLEALQILFASQEISCAATQEISCVATEEISCVATE